MKSLNEHIKRFKIVSGLINEDVKTGCQSGDCVDGKGVFTGNETNNTGSFHNPNFTYEGDFVDGSMDNGIINFNDGISYTGYFIGGKIEGDGEFNFPNKSSYRGYVTTKKEGNKIKYELETKQRTIPDIIDYYNKHPYEKIVYDEYGYEDNNKDITKTKDFDIYFIATDNNTVTYKENYTGELNIIKNEIKFFMRSLAFKDITKSFETNNGKYKLINTTLGKYKIKCSIKDYANFETEIEINDSTNNIVIEVPNKGKLSFNLKYELDRVKKTINDLLPSRSKTKSVSQGEKSTKEELNYCKTKIKDFYEIYLNVEKQKIKLSQLDLEDLLYAKKNIENCIIKYPSNFDNKTKEYVLNLNRVGYPVENQKYFKLNRTLTENKNIYNKTNNMGISNTIRKVLNEQSELKKVSLVEKQIIENRLNFVLETKSNKKQKLFNEAKDLINKGYDKKLVKDTVKNYLK